MHNIYEVWIKSIYKVNIDSVFKCILWMHVLHITQSEVYRK